MHVLRPGLILMREKSSLSPSWIVEERRERRRLVKKKKKKKGVAGRGKSSRKLVGRSPPKVYAVRVGNTIRVNDLNEAEYTGGGYRCATDKTDSIEVYIYLPFPAISTLYAGITGEYIPGDRVSG